MGLPDRYFRSADDLRFPDWTGYVIFPEEEKNSRFVAGRDRDTGFLPDLCDLGTLMLRYYTIVPG
jgi:hypothetical protein